MKIKTFTADTSIRDWNIDNKVNDFVEGKKIIECKVTVAGNILIIVIFY